MGGKPRNHTWLDLNDPKFQKTCANCGETWNDALVDHECRALIALCKRIDNHEYGDAPLNLTDEDARRLARTILAVYRIAKRNACTTPYCSNAEHILARVILRIVENGP